MGSVYGAGPYGSGRYGGNVVALPAGPSDDGRPRVARHLLGVGPWAEGVLWKAVNWKLVPSRRYPAAAILNLGAVGIASASFTLRRTEPSEARVELRQPRNSALLITEMETDLWWRRGEPDSTVNEPIGRFNADAVTLSLDGDTLTTSATFVDWRGVLEERLVLIDTAIAGYPAGTTAVTAVLTDILPTNADVDLSALSTVNLGMTTHVLQWTAPLTVADAITKLRRVSPPFDWAVEAGIDKGDRPRLMLWPGQRGADRGVTLVDTGNSLGPIRSWRRRTNSGDYANFVIFDGQGESSSRPAVTDDLPNLPTGQRDASGSDPDIIDIDTVQKAAEDLLAQREQRLAAWEITLVPSFWRGRDHIDLGDRVRVIVRLGDELIDETHVVEEISVEAQPSGEENVTLQLGWGVPSTNPQSKRNPTSLIVKALRELARRT